ncbi:CD99 molecule like 4 isoform X1 [Rattus norvegicus]
MELRTLLLLGMVIQVDSLTLWVIARSWPVLMPVHSNSTVLPTFFSTSCLRDVPCIVPNGELPQRYTATNLSLLHTLCCTLINSSQACVWLRRTTLANWLDPMSSSAMGASAILAALSQVTQGASSGSGDTSANNSAELNITTLIMMHNCSFPSRPGQGNHTLDNSTCRRVLPTCPPYQKFPPDFTPCQSPFHRAKQFLPGFEFSPPLGHVQFDWGGNKTGKHNFWPWYQWVLSNEQGAYTSLIPFTRLLGEDFTLYNISATRTNNKTSLVNVKINGLLANDTAVGASVCVRPPFFFLISTNVGDDALNCNNSAVVCSLAECWNGTNDTTVMVKIPSFVPIPVEANPDSFPILNLLRTRRDFGITAAIISAIVLSAAAATTATIAMTNQVQTAETINQIVERTAVALEIQEEFNTYLASGFLLANQWIDLIQELIEALYHMTRLSCLSSLRGLCITLLQANFSQYSQHSKEISNYLKGNWSMKTEQLSRQLLVQIAVLNNTRLEPITFGDFTSWITNAFSFFKEWAGMFAWGAIVLLGCRVCLWLLCCLKRACQTQSDCLPAYGHH